MIVKLCARPLFQLFHRLSFLLVLLGIFVLLTPKITEAAAPEKTIVIGSGGPTGVYYPVAISICRIFNQQYEQRGYGCSVEISGGSVDNLEKLRAGTVNFAIVQSDWQSHAFDGSLAFSSHGPHQQLRSVYALYSESFTVLARSDSKIRKFEDMVGRGINVGNTGSGQRATMDLIMVAYGWTPFTFSNVREFASNLQAQALCDGEVEAIIFVAGHPSGTIKDATEKCKTNFVNVEGPVIDALIAENDYYRKAAIPAGMYRGQSDEIPTFGVNATMVTTTETPDVLVDYLVKSVFENIDRLKKMHPALANLDVKEMSKNIMPAPLHDRAEVYYESQRFGE